ncbi:hypothetical protein HID58_089192, partial [Brassica napus]
QTISMANSYTVLADLRAGRCSNAAERGQLMSLEMLLIVEQVTAISQYNSATFNDSTVSRPFTLPENLGRPLPYLWESLLAKSLKQKPTDSVKNGGLETSERNLSAGPLPGHKKRLTIAFMNRYKHSLR